MPQLAPVLEPEEYIEQAYFFHAFKLRQAEGLASQDILDRVHEEILSTTKLPMAIQFMATEMKHSGLLSSALQRLPHYFTSYQAFIISRAEVEGLRFSMDTALEILEWEATYRSQSPTRQGMFVYQFEVLCRNRLGYDLGLDAMMLDSFYDADWRDYLETVRRNIGEVEFADLVYLHSQSYAKEHRKKQSKTKKGSKTKLPKVLFGEKEGKIARANRGRDPLFLFAALQRQLGYPKVPYRKPMHDPLAQLPTILAKQRELEQRLKLIETEGRERKSAIDLEQIKPIELDS